MTDQDDPTENDNLPESGTAVVPKPSMRVKEPALYKVLLHNDDYTPMEFVIEVLEKYFNKDRANATRIMLDVHHKGHGVCGIYPCEIAETKVALVVDSAREREYPLKCTMEQA